MSWDTWTQLFLSHRVLLVNLGLKESEEPKGPRVKTVLLVPQALSDPLAPL